MELSLNAIVEQLDELTFSWGAARWRHLAGLEGPVRTVEVLGRWPELLKPEALQHVREVAESNRLDETRRARVKLLLAGLARLHLSHHRAAADEALELRRLQVVERDGRAQTAEAARLSRWRGAEVEERRALSSLAGAALAAGDASWRAGVDALVAQAEARGFPTAEALVTVAHGRGPSQLVDEAARLLRDTDDAFRDLLAYGLKRVASTLKPGEAHLADVERAVAAPWLDGLLYERDFMPALTRCWGDLGFHPNASGRIALDGEARPGRRVGQHVVPLRVPDEVRLLLVPGDGLASYAQGMRAWALAQHRAHVERQRPFVERSLGDAAVPLAFGHLFAGLLFDVGWLKRYLRLTPTQAREVARHAALGPLLEARRLAALVPTSAEVLGRGTWPELADEVQERLSTALRGTAPPGELAGLGLWPGDEVDGLKALGLAASLRALLPERFNEDWWRNPAAGRWLQGLAGQGQRETAEGLASQFQAGAPELKLAATQWVACLGQ